MAKLHPIWAYDANGATVHLEARRALGRKQVLPFVEWRRHPDLMALRNRARLGLEDADGCLEISVETSNEGHDLLRLSPRTLAGMNDTVAGRLELVETTTSRFDLRTDSVPSSDQFRIRIRFLDRSGQATRRTVEGATLRFGSARERLPEPLYGIYKAASTLAEPVENRDLRFERIAALCDVLNETLGTEYESDAFLDSLDIAYASHLSVQSDAVGDGILVKPILFGRQAAQQAEEIEPEDLEGSDDSVESTSLRLTEAEGLLDKDSHRKFLDRIAQTGLTQAVRLGPSRYVYMPTSVGAAAQAVLNANEMEPEEREAFLRNPRPMMREAIARSGADGEPEMLFVPTQEYSARVQGIGYWKAPVLPWIVNQPNSWIPERCGIKGGDALIEITPAQAEAVLPEVREALQQGSETISISGQVMDVSSALVESLSQLASLPSPTSTLDNTETSAQSDTEATDTLGPPPDYRKHFLIIEENFEDLAYAGRRGTELRSWDAQRISPPQTLVSTLKSYQQAGLEWLCGARTAGHRGALLADDMGLGKTLQTLCALAKAREEQTETPKPILIVAPTALIHNWVAEMKLHFCAGAFGEVFIATGPALTTLRTGNKRDTQRGTPSLDTDQLRRKGIVLTTYETLRDYHLSFAKVSFGFVVFDEIQKLKNPATQLARAAKSVNAKFWIGLTGTPVENRLHDLWSITDILWPGLLGSSREFNTQYADCSEAAMEGLEKKLINPPGTGTLPFIFRRMKKDQATDLPTKTVRKIDATMPPEQANTFRAIVSEARRTDVEKTSILQVIQNMRAVSLHPLKVERARDMDPDDYVTQSARLLATIQTLDEINTLGEKALIFLESLDLQDWLAGYLRDRYGLPRRPFVINGGVPGQRRQQMVDEFQSTLDGFDVMILSPKAGGVGLTITAANHVIHLSRWWNPAVENQATDRVFRIGQARPVTVYLPLALHPDEDLRGGSFDVNLHKLLERKRSMADRLLSPAMAGSDSLQELFDNVVINTDPNRDTDYTNVQTSEAPSKSTTSLPDQSSSRNEHVQSSTSPSPEERGPKDKLAVGQPIAEIATRDLPGPAVSPEEPYSGIFPANSAPGRVFSVLDDKSITRLHLEDAYCALPGNREAVMKLMGEELLSRAEDGCKVTLHYYGMESHLRSQYDATTQRALTHTLFQTLKEAAGTARQSGIRADFRPVSRRIRQIHDRILFIRARDTTNHVVTYKITLPHDIRQWLNGRMSGDISIREVPETIWNTL